MQKLYSLLCMDFKRAFCSKRFFLAVLIFPVTDIFAIMLEQNVRGELFYVLERLKMFGLAPLCFVIYAIPYSYSYCEDINHHFIKYSFIRTGKKQYVISKFIACGISGGSAVLLGKLCTMMIFALKMPLWEWENAMDEADTFYYILAASGKVELVFGIILILFFLNGALFACAALAVSVFISNPFVVGASPIIINYVVVNVVGIIGTPFLSLGRIYFIRGELFPTAAGTIGYAAFITIFMSCVLGMISYRKICRRFYYE